MPSSKLKPDDIDELSLLTLEEVHAKLGKGYSPRSIRRRIANGEYKQGIHYFRTGGVSGLIKIHLPSIKQNLIDINS
ncbi:MAG: hypothetical protein KME54_23300 [Tolypothrix brevis GSE-NOS-MK-07-07A]|jgi:hypothetical protein|nr:hypothetical protein [Tolypothrix brevis GSE-NOS-MK-07-07A]